MALSEKRKKYLRDRYEKNKEEMREKNAKKRREWRKKYPKKARKADKIKREKYKEKRKKYKREYQKNYERDPVKVAARTKLNNAVKKGEIERPEKCPECEKEKMVEGHHPDYSKPLDVKWLCRQCHALEHYPID